ncbi:MAG: hypothetical protein ACYCZ7_02110 [Minisyncoccota bacterium]
MNTSKDGFRFSHDHRFGAVSYIEFLVMARLLCQTVSKYRDTVDIDVLTAEDSTTYNYTTTTFLSDDVEKALENRKCYTLDELTREVWDRSFHVKLVLRDEKTQSFMVCISCDKFADAKRLRFYGQCLDEATHYALVNKFHHASLSHGIGNGGTRVSTFNMIMLARLTGMRLPF